MPEPTCPLREMSVVPAHPGKTDCKMDGIATALMAMDVKKFS
jgi:hypothetical protein